MSNRRRSVRIRVGKKNSMSSTSVVGDYHPNTRSVYITEDQYQRILSVLGVSDTDVLTADSPGEVKIVEEGKPTRSLIREIKHAN